MITDNLVFCLALTKHKDTKRTPNSSRHDDEDDATFVLVRTRNSSRHDERERTSGILVLL